MKITASNTQQVTQNLAKSTNQTFQENEKQWESLAVFIENKERVFVDVTASWCVTCQVNERAVINKPEIQKFFKVKFLDQY